MHIINGGMLRQRDREDTLQMIYFKGGPMRTETNFPTSKALS